MKKMLLGLLVVSFCFSSTTTTAQTTTSKTTTSSKSTASPINGAWRSVDNKEFAIMSDGFFSSVAQDSTGKWAETHAGTYTVDNANTITLKVTHSSHAYRIGSLHTIEYDIKGENLTIKWFKKLVGANGVDETAQMPKGTQTQYVRAKQ